MAENNRPEYVPMPDAVREFVKEFDANKEEDFFPTGFPSHDRILGRYRRGYVTFIGARPSMGKTAFMLKSALAQLKAGIKVYFFSLEMPKIDMIARLVSLETGIPLFDILERRIDEKRAREIVGALPFLEELPANWTEESNLKRIADLFSRIEPKSRSIIYVDYLGLIQVTGMDASQQYAVTTEAALSLKRAAKSLQVPVVAAVQLNRQVETRKEKQPVLSDFRDSGRLEEIGDVCLGLHRPGFYDKSPDTELQVFCFKNRNGPRVNYILDWYGPCARATEKTKLSWTEVA